MGTRRSSSEEVLLQERGVLVSTARLVVGDRTYAVGQITSTRFVTIPGVPGDWSQRYAPGVCAALLGPLLAALDVSLWVAEGMAGALVVAGAGVLVLAATPWAFAWGLRRPTPMRCPQEYVAAVATSGGEVQVLRDADGAFVRRVVDAVSDALVARG